MSATATSNGASLPSAFDHGAERLLETITATCDPRAGFAKQVESALRAALALLATEPALARLLTVETHMGDEMAIGRYQYWRKRYGALLRHSAGADPEIPVHPRFLEPMLISGISYQVSSRVLAGQADHLPQLLPAALSFLLAPYIEPRWRAHIARVALEGR